MQAGEGTGQPRRLPSGVSVNLTHDVLGDLEEEEEKKEGVGSREKGLDLEVYYSWMDFIQEHDLPEKDVLPGNPEAYTPYTHEPCTPA